MKKQTAGLFMPMNKEDLISLSIQVNEILDTDYNKRNNLALCRAGISSKNCIKSGQFLYQKRTVVRALLF